MRSLSHRALRATYVPCLISNHMLSKGFLEDLNQSLVVAFQCKSVKDVHLRFQVVCKWLLEAS